MRSQLKVKKNGGGVEEYLHTKVIGAINNALSRSGRADVYTAEQLADVVTYYLYHKRRRNSVDSMEILSMIKAVLTSTGHDEAAVALSEHHMNRRIRRRRVDVISVHVRELADAQAICGIETASSRSPWDKSIIVDDLMTEHDIPQQTARTIASMVEEKVFNMGISVVPASLVRQLVLSDTAAILHAEEQLQMA